MREEGKPLQSVQPEKVKVNNSNRLVKGDGRIREAGHPASHLLHLALHQFQYLPDFLDDGQRSAIKVKRAAMGQ